jgi:hypothetical protein
MLPLMLILMNISTYELFRIAMHPLIVGIVLACLLFVISARRYEAHQKAQKIAHERQMQRAQKLGRLEHQYQFIQQITDQSKR